MKIKVDKKKEPTKLKAGDIVEIKRYETSNFYIAVSMESAYLQNIEGESRRYHEPNQTLAGVLQELTTGLNNGRISGFTIYSKDEYSLKLEKNEQQGA